MLAGIDNQVYFSLQFYKKISKTTYTSVALNITTLTKDVEDAFL